MHLQAVLIAMVAVLAIERATDSGRAQVDARVTSWPYRRLARASRLWPRHRSVAVGRRTEAGGGTATARSGLMQLLWAPVRRRLPASAVDPNRGPDHTLRLHEISMATVHSAAADARHVDVMRRPTAMFNATKHRPFSVYNPDASSTAAVEVKSSSRTTPPSSLAMWHRMPRLHAWLTRQLGRHRLSSRRREKQR